MTKKERTAVKWLTRWVRDDPAWSSIVDHILKTGGNITEWEADAIVTILKWVTR